MEVKAALITFKRSLFKNGLRYTTVMSDGDSRTMHGLKEKGVYGFIPIGQEIAEESAGPDGLPAPSCTEAIADEVGLMAPPASGNASESGRIRRNTVMLQPEDVLQREVFAREQLKALPSTPATERKSNLVTSADGPPDESSFMIANLDCVNVLLSAEKCRVCGDSVTFTTGERAYGLSIKMVIACAMCGDIASEWSSPRVKSDKKVNPFVVNVLAARAMQTTGNRQTALNDVFATMNISHRGLHTETWQGYMKEKLAPAATRAADNVMATSARSVRKLYDDDDLQLGNPGNISVTYDGSWMTRGHSSNIGAWKDNHVCQKNTEKKAGEVEVEVSLILFERSLQQHNLRHTTILSDGDCRTYLALVDAKVYGFTPVTKEDRVNYVKERMGASLRNLLAKGGFFNRPGSTRKIVGSPRQLESAVPTSKNPNGVWV
ncbi:hypothetical protein HPB48_008719 [Haemaphysalis longicornis]|uniref:Mutator-like transposase domain-containing protein n=1 Tax=Haemaphysalis longicornis TaxID=44386 RepID=A0A9J6GBK7_HAELO|nr:hypothetical protein HPB48_008719 [Haemaphysalis longicornis]